MKNAYIISFIYFIFCMTHASAEKLIWLSEDVNIIDEFNSDNAISITHDTTRLMLKQLTNIDYEFAIYTLPRIKKLLTSQSNYCMSGRIRTPEREKHSLFSQPVHLYPNIKLYYTDKIPPLDQSLFDDEGYLLSLKALFDKYPEHFLTAAKGRSYGLWLDQQISELDKKNLNYRSGLSHYSSLAKMLLKNHVDFILAYPTIFDQLLFEDAEQSKHIYSVSIVKNKPYVLGRVQCTKTALGAKTIKNINQLLDRLYQNKEFYNIHTRALLVNDRADFKKNFEHVFIKRNF